MSLLEEILVLPPEEGAPLLLGSVIVSDIGGARVRVRIEEVEAYRGADDPASHAHRGPTPRNGSMFARPGTLYVYRSYGVHNCANTSAGPAGTGWGILFRGGEVVEGEAIVRERRGRDSDLADGPGKLCQALGVDLSHDGLYLLAPDSPIRLEQGDSPEVVVSTPRVGITKAKDRPWRFVAATMATARR
ncbi:MAG: DNA-3-methyladenine glycosylase [Acidimicrobiia bacterium]